VEYCKNQKNNGTLTLTTFKVLLFNKCPYYFDFGSFKANLIHIDISPPEKVDVEKPRLK